MPDPERLTLHFGFNYVLFADFVRLQGLRAVNYGGQQGAFAGAGVAD